MTRDQSEFLISIARELPAAIVIAASLCGIAAGLWTLTVAWGG